MKYLVIALVLVSAGFTNGVSDCPTEDSVNCYWNARTMGDGYGQSYFSGGAEK